MTPAWVGAAKGIPVWARASVVVPDHDEVRPRSERSQMIALDVFEDGRWRVLQTLPEVIYLYRGVDLIPDLTDPDTRAAYIRRLAVALGGPESTADIGVTFQASGDGYECAAGRKITMEGGTFTPWRWHTGGDPRFAVADERVALALAWPADKRVTT